MSGWKNTWHGGQATCEKLRARLAAHGRAEQRVLGDTADGWLARVHGRVAAKLATSPGRGYSGHHLPDLLRAMRNIFECRPGVQHSLKGLGHSTRPRFYQNLLYS